MWFPLIFPLVFLGLVIEDTLTRLVFFTLAFTLAAGGIYAILP